MIPVFPLLSVFALLAGCSLPSDTKLQENFFRHESEFNRIIQMSNEDAKVVRIATNFTWLDTDASWPRPDSQIGFSRERWNEYRSLFKKLDLEGGLIRDRDLKGVVFLPAKMTGMATGGTEKGYAYSEEKLVPCFDSLDQPPKGTESLKPVFKHIKGKWYLYYVYDD